MLLIAASDVSFQDEEAPVISIKEEKKTKKRVTSSFFVSYEFVSRAPAHFHATSLDEKGKRMRGKKLAFTTTCFMTMTKHMLPKL